jgi:gamma-polyglutamate synthase
MIVNYKNIIFELSNNIPAILFLLLMLLIIFLIIESYLLKKTLKKIPIRIHVNGTRGKSSVTRLIAAGLNTGGIRTCAKTTGTAANFIDPKGNSKPIFRIGSPNIIEQLKILRWAAKLKTEAIVLECMALQPTLQAICELKILRSTHSVLTNIVPDHLDVMGPSLKDVAISLSETIPCKGKYFTTEKKHILLLKSVAEKRKSEVFTVSKKEVAELTDEEMNNFNYLEFKKNVALALKVCLDLGITRQIALQGMWSAIPDPGALVEYKSNFNSQEIIFANAFAANDPASTKKTCHTLIKKYKALKNKVLIVNCRKDRQLRSIQLAKTIAFWKALDIIVLVGNNTNYFQYYYEKHKRHNITKLITMKKKSPEIIFKEIMVNLTTENTLILGIGNIAGLGLEITSFFKKKAENKI